jgi:hypothetical protein
MMSRFASVATPQTPILETDAIWAQGSFAKDAGGFDARPGKLAALRLAIVQRPDVQRSVGSARRLGRHGANTGDHASELRHAYTVGGNVI